MRILVTGGAGYIGSHAVRALSRQGHEVLIYDNLSTGHAALAAGFELITGDIRDSGTLRQALRGVNAVMHFAAHAYVGESVQDPRKYFDNNVEGGLALLNAALDSGIRMLVFSSSAAVYGRPERIPINEAAPRQPLNPYGVSKLFFENALEAYDRAYGLRSMSLRYFNAAGADPSAAIGEMHEPETHLIPLALQAAAGLRAELELFGNDYPTEDGTCIRDYIHVQDLAKAHVMGLEYLREGGPSQALNLGTGTGNSVNEVISAVERIVGRSLSRRVCARREGDPPVLVADPSRAHEILNWRASLSLTQMVSDAWNWMQVSQRR
jgi:UDP-glucose-4-epimerase GalE